MTHLNLHIGHGKTGSSFLQSILANNRDWLHENYNILYPRNAQNFDERGLISSGNGDLLLKNMKDGELDKIIAENAESNILLSSEMLYHHVDDWLRADVLKMLDRFEKIKILLFIRDPVELIGSSYQQSIKRHGYTDDIDVFSDNFVFYKRLANTIDAINRCPKTELTISNYSRSRKRVDKVMQGFLSIPDFPESAFPVVNRSLTFAELTLIRSLNNFDKMWARQLSDALCNRHPNIKSDTISPSQKNWEGFLEREKAFIERVNAHCPEGEQLSMEFASEDRASWARNLGLGQLKTLASVLGRHLQQKDP